MKYSIIIPTRDHCDQLLKPCLESVFAHTHMDHVQVIVSADGCVDNTHWYLKRLKNQFVSLGFEDHFHVIEQHTAQGFAHACNQAVRQSNSEYVVFLHSDCVINHSDWLVLLNQSLTTHEKVGVSAFSMKYSEQLATNYVEFDCVMMPRHIWHQVGELDEQLQWGLASDLDWCVRMLSQGWQINTVTAPHPIVTHKQAGTLSHMSLEMDWPHVYKQNMTQIAQKTHSATTHMPIMNISDVQNTYGWLRQGNSESEYLFKEVIQNNTYKVNHDMITGMSVIDVGANQGMFSILAAALGAMQVVACEPIRSTHALLSANVHRSGLPQITCVHKAVMGKCTGPLMISVHEESGHNSLYNMGQTHELVHCVTLQELVDSCSQPHIFLKMDCEGAEYDIVLDSDPQVFDRIKYIGVEIHGDMHPDHKGVEKLQQAFSNLGFTLISREQVGTWYWNAEGEVVRFDPMPQTVEVWGK